MYLNLMNSKLANEPSGARFDRYVSTTRCNCLNGVHISSGVALIQTKSILETETFFSMYGFQWEHKMSELYRTEFYHTNEHNQQNWNSMILRNKYSPSAILLVYFSRFWIISVGFFSFLLRFLCQKWFYAFPSKMVLRTTHS